MSVMFDFEQQQDLQRNTNIGFISVQDKKESLHGYIFLV